jgi:hypothetical protein
VFVTVASLNWYCPGGLSVMVPSVVQLLEFPGI